MTLKNEGYPLRRRQCNGSCGIRTADSSLDVQEVRLGLESLSFLAPGHF